jgi:hypothetical protein
MNHQRNALFKIICATGVAIVAIGYIATLRIVDGSLYRNPMILDHPAIGVILAIISLPMLWWIFAGLKPEELPDIEVEDPKRELMDLGILLVLMFPGTGLAFAVLPRFGCPEIVPAILQGWTYGGLPILYVAIKRHSLDEGLADLGFFGKKYIWKDLGIALIFALLSVTIIEPFNQLVFNLTGFSGVPPSQAQPLLSVLIVTSISMSQNITWNGLMQNRVERAFDYSLKGFIVFLIMMNILLQIYFEPKSDFMSFIRAAPGNTVGLIICCTLFRKTRRIATPAFWHWFANLLGMMPQI